MLCSRRSDPWTKPDASYCKWFKATTGVKSDLNAEGFMETGGAGLQVQAFNMFFPELGFRRKAPTVFWAIVFACFACRTTDHSKSYVCLAFIGKCKLKASWGAQTSTGESGQT